MTPATKAMPKIQDDKKEKEAAQEREKKKREEDAAAIAEAEKGGKKARYEYQDTSVAALVHLHPTGGVGVSRSVVA